MYQRQEERKQWLQQQEVAQNAYCSGKAYKSFIQFLQDQPKHQGWETKDWFRGLMPKTCHQQDQDSILRLIQGQLNQDFGDKITLESSLKETNWAERGYSWKVRK